MCKQTSVVLADNVSTGLFTYGTNNAAGSRFEAVYKLPSVGAWRVTIAVHIVPNSTSVPTLHAIVAQLPYSFTPPTLTHTTGGDYAALLAVALVYVDDNQTPTTGQSAATNVIKGPQTTTGSIGATVFVTDVVTRQFALGWWCVTSASTQVNLTYSVIAYPL